MVGMTGMPEAALARELGLRYAVVAVVVNHAAGRGDSSEAIHLDQINDVLQASMVKVRSLLDKLMESGD
jgi:5'-methylthioadenosine phosphorylase